MGSLIRRPKNTKVVIRGGKVIPNKLAYTGSEQTTSATGSSSPKHGAIVSPVVKEVYAFPIGGPITASTVNLPTTKSTATISRSASMTNLSTPRDCLVGSKSAVNLPTSQSTATPRTPTPHRVSPPTPHRISSQSAPGKRTLPSHRNEEPSPGRDEDQIKKSKSTDILRKGKVSRRLPKSN